MPSLGRIGQIYEVIRKDWELLLAWEIPRFLDLARGGDWDYYESPHFSYAGARWHLQVFPDVEGGVLLGLRRDASGPSSVTVNASAGFKGGPERKEKEGEFEKGSGCVFYGLCERCELAEGPLLPGGVLTPICNMRDVTPSTGEVLVIYSLKELQEATRNFCDRFKIGEGGFGTVYKAVIRGDDVAVKKMKDPADEQFVVELKTLANYRHDNLVPLLGVALGTTTCLLYEFMPNGSLEDRLACKNKTEPLSWRTRLSISYGSALGINHLHTFAEKPEVHRDIKSANILLDRNLVPKVGDFGLVRTGDSGGSTTHPVTRRCMGTPGYMPKEALVGDVSVKWDTYSFGVVLLELLTGLPPFDRNRKYIYLITHMEHCQDIISRLDPKAKWNKTAATDLYRIAQRCLAESKRSRPTISEILEDLRKLSLRR